MVRRAGRAFDGQYMTTADLTPFAGALPDVPPKVARLWRERGQAFLDLHREALFEEIDRLHSLIDLGEEVVIDLRERAETGLHCHRHLQAQAVARCAECDLPYCDDCLVQIPTDHDGRVCLNCTLELAGIRVRHHR